MICFYKVQSAVVFAIACIRPLVDRSRVSRTVWRVGITESQLPELFPSGFFSKLCFIIVTDLQQLGDHKYAVK